MADGSVGGFTADKYSKVRDAFQANLASGADVGASFCATADGETVVDLWGGWADAEKTRPWEKDTIVNVYSTTKTMTALTALLLADRGELDFAAPVAKYWPEFAANGKADVKVSHLMSHSAGLSGWKESITTEDLTTLYRLLLGSGMDRTAMNRIRKRFTRWAGGRLAAALGHAHVKNFTISDVIGDDLGSIGSGPCTPDPSSAADKLVLAWALRTSVSAQCSCTRPHGSFQ